MYLCVLAMVKNDYIVHDRLALICWSEADINLKKFL